MKPHNPYASSAKSMSSAQQGYSARLESTNLERGLSSMSVAEHGRLASIGRTPSMRCGESSYCEKVRFRAMTMVLDVGAC